MSTGHTGMIVDGIHALSKETKDPRTLAIILAGIFAATLKDETINELIRLMGTMRGRD